MGAILLPEMANWPLLQGLLVSASVWCCLGLIGGIQRRPGHAAHLLHASGAVTAAAVALLALLALPGEPRTLTIDHGMAGFALHFRLDALSALFAALLGLVSAGVSLFSAGYFSTGDDASGRRICVQYHLFIASMLIVLLADDTATFMLAWELMSIASFLLVVTDHRDPATRRAGYLYLLIAHAGALAILAALLLLQVDPMNTSFEAMRENADLRSGSSVVFLLALAGFGAKAGLLPLHAWLPEAHPAAPSPVSALMSAVMLKTAVYGLLRVTLDLLQVQSWWWGALLLGLGLASALGGVLFAAIQTDMKRLLAWSSIENMGLIFCGMGLAVLFSSHGMQPMAALALTAALCHVVAHALFKSLLFLGTGAVLHATGERNLGRLGGLICTMPWVGWLMLIATLASAALPPSAGFVAEWLLLQCFLFTPLLPDPFLNLLIPVVAAVIILASALAGYTMVKFFGIIFLGQVRGDAARACQDAGRWERAGLVWLAIACALAGLVPTVLIRLIDPAVRQLTGRGASEELLATPWILVPVDIDQASYAPLVLLLGIVGTAGGLVIVLRRLYPGRIRRSPPWNCGYEFSSSRMQDSAEGFGQPIRHIFGQIFGIRRELPSPFDHAPHYEVSVRDRIWEHAYLPIARAIRSISAFAERLHPVSITACLMPVFVAMLAIIAWAVL